MGIRLASQLQEKNTLFSKLLVEDSMRRQVITLPMDQIISSAIRTIIKFKVDAVLVTDGEGLPAGIITKTEIMGTYYADLPLEIPLSDIMASPVITCSPKDTLESALVTMQQAAIHRIYVTNEGGKAIGTLSYPDIVGHLYRFCCDCDYGMRKRSESSDHEKLRYSIKDVMTPTVTTALDTDSITEVIEKLSSFQLGALLIIDESGKHAGVISKTDLALAYCRNVPLDANAHAIMNGPVKLCADNQPLEEGIRQMVFSEISRLFVHGSDHEVCTGVLSLSDAARTRSGSCQACSSARIKVKEQ